VGQHIPIFPNSFPGLSMSVASFSVVGSCEATTMSSSALLLLVLVWQQQGLLLLVLVEQQ
jgi:hypothetical protein